MVTEVHPESPVPESGYTDYEQDLVNEGLPPAQARAARRALERIVDRLMLSLASKADLREVRNEMRDELRDHGRQITRVLQDAAALKAEMKLLKWMFAIGGSALIGLTSAVLVVLFSRL